MSTPEPRPTPTLGSTLGTLARTDRWVQTALAVACATVLFSLSPWISFGKKLLVLLALAPLLLSLTLLALLWRRRDLSEPAERRFRLLLAAGFGSLVVMTGFYSLSAAAGLSAQVVSVTANLAFATAYFFLVLASEEEPDQPHRTTSSRFEALITWPAAGFFVFGLWIYFTLLPPFGQGASRSTPVQAVHLLLALDTYLAARFGLLARLSEAPRWRLLYHAWALTFGAHLIDNLLRLITSAHPEMTTLTLARYAFWVVPHLLAVISARMPFLPAVTRPTARRAAPFEGARLPAAGSKALIFALSFPTVHLLFHELGLLDETYKQERAVMAFGWMLLMGLVAFTQTRLLDRRAAEIWAEQKRFENQLSSREDDLRLILERRRATRSLQIAEERFERIFRICPDAVAITLETDGRIVDVNPGFEHTTGMKRDEILGKSFEEIGLGSYPGGREALLRRLEKNGAALELEINFHHAEGQLRIARLLLDRVTIEGERCLIILARDITERRRAEIEREKQAALLENASAAIFALDSEERISFWNRGAERLFGRTAGDALGRTADDLETASSQAPPLAADLWSTLIIDDQGRSAGRLVIAGDSSPVEH